MNVQRLVNPRKRAWWRPRVPAYPTASTMASLSNRYHTYTRPRLRVHMPIQLYQCTLRNWELRKTDSTFARRTRRRQLTQLLHETQEEEDYYYNSTFARNIKKKDHYLLTEIFCTTRSASQKNLHLAQHKKGAGYY